MVYVKLFVDYLDAIEPLGDAERGRLFTALLEYARTGEVPQLGGNERFIFPMMKAQLDRDAASNMELSEKRAAAGSLGGKQKQANLANGSKSYQDKDKEEDKDKDKEEDEDEDKEEDEDEDESDKTRARRFTPPALDDVIAYCQERGKGVDAQRWYDYYSSNGWKVGKNAMKDWKAAVRTWENNGYGNQSGRKTMPKQYTTEGSFFDD